MSSDTLNSCLNSQITCAFSLAVLFRKPRHSIFFRYAFSALSLCTSAIKSSSTFLLNLGGCSFLVALAEQGLPRLYFIKPSAPSSKYNIAFPPLKLFYIIWLFPFNIFPKFSHSISIPQTVLMHIHYNRYFEFCTIHFVFSFTHKNMHLQKCLTFGAHIIIRERIF